MTSNQSLGLDAAGGMRRVGPAYSPVARTLHWVTAVLVLAIIPVGFVMTNIHEGPTQDFLFHLHESVGATLLLLVATRLVYRLAHPPLPLPAAIPAWQRQGAAFVHWSFYALLLLQPVIGWIGTSAYRAPIGIFWLFELPPIAPENRGFSDRIFGVHEAIGIALAALIAVHVSIAFYHHFVRRDGVMARMLRG